MENKKYLQEKKENMFGRIMSFFKRLFQTKKEEETVKETKAFLRNTSEEKLKFMREIQETEQDDIKVEELGIIQIQEMYESDRLSLNNLSDSKVIELNELYRKQIKQLEEKIRREEGKKASNL